MKGKNGLSQAPFRVYENVTDYVDITDFRALNAPSLLRFQTRVKKYKRFSFIQWKHIRTTLIHHIA